VSLYEGERRRCQLEVENAKTAAPVTWWRLHCAEHGTIADKNNNNDNNNNQHHRRHSQHHRYHHYSQQHNNNNNNNIGGGADWRENLYETELYNNQQVVARWLDENDLAAELAGGDRRSLYVELFGKRNCSAVTLYIDYGCGSEKTKGVAGAEVDQGSAAVVRYRRRLTVRLALTVRPALRLTHFDILPLINETHNNMPGILERRNSVVLNHQSSAGDSRFPKCTSVEELLLSSSRSQHGDNLVNRTSDETADGINWCLAVFDLQNLTDRPLELTFHFNASGDGDGNFNLLESCRIDASHELPPITAAKQSVTVYARQRQRIGLPVRRMMLRSCLARAGEAASDSSAEGVDYFEIVHLPDDPIFDVPAIPVPRHKQFIATATAEGDGSATEVAEMENATYSVLLHRYLKQHRDRLPSITNETRPWWVHELVDDNGSLLLRNFMRVAVARERQERLRFWYRDQLFRQQLPAVDWRFVLSSASNSSTNSSSTTTPDAAAAAGNKSSSVTPQGQLDLRSLAIVRLTDATLNVLQKQSFNLKCWLSVDDNDNYGTDTIHRRIKQQDACSGQLIAHFKMEFSDLLQAANNDRYRLLIRPAALDAEQDQMWWCGQLDTVLSACNQWEYQLPLFLLAPGRYRVEWAVEQLLNPAKFINNDSTLLIAPFRDRQHSNDRVQSFQITVYE
jgi:hypothetical protein